MREDDGDQGAGATAFDLSNGQNPRPHAPIYYGNQHVPKPTNAAAKITEHAKVMSQVLHAHAK
jgi:hypothetical protein